MTALQAPVTPVVLSAFELLQRFGVIAVLFLIILTGIRRMWVWGWQYEEVVKDRDAWRAMALKDTPREPAPR